MGVQVRMHEGGCMWVYVHVRGRECGYVSVARVCARAMFLLSHRCYNCARQKGDCMPEQAQKRERQSATHQRLHCGAHHF